MSAVWLGIAISICALDVTIMYSVHTPFTISSVQSLLPFFPEISLHLVSANSPSDLSLPVPPVVLDYTYSRDLSLRLLDLAVDSLVICMYSNCPSQELRGRLQAEDTARDIAAYLQALDLKKLFVAASVTPYYQEIAHYLATRTSLILTDVVTLDTDMSRSDVESFVGRLFKPSGNVVAAILVDEVTGLSLYSAIEHFRIAKKGYAYLLSDEAAWSTQPQGVLYVTDSVARNATSRVQFEASVLEDQLRELGPLTGMEERPQRHFFNKTTRKMSVALMNMVGGTPVLVGNSPTSLRSNVLFPGNTSEVPVVQKPVIDVGADFTALNWDGSTFPTGYQVTRGIQLAYAEVNRNSEILTNFQFRNNSVNLGAAKWNKTWALSQFNKYRNELGVAFHAFGYSGTIGAIEGMFQQLGYFTSITSIATGPQLSNPVVYPMFLRTSSSGAVAAMVMARFFQLWKWMRLAIIYSNSLGDMTFYNMFLNYTVDYRMTIVNNETNRILPLDLSGDAAQAQLNASLYEIMNTTVRIIVLAHTNAPMILARMTQLGVQAGDYQICLSYGLSYSQYNAPEHRQQMQGAMMFYDMYFVGPEGERIRKMFVAADGNNYEPVSCVFYDGAMLVAHAVAFMLARGMIYEDGEELVSVMRQTRFIGCLGIQQIEQGTNDRVPQDFSVMNAHIGPNNSMTLINAAFYTPGKTQLYTVTPNLTFPDNTTGPFYDSWQNDTLCPYLSKDIRDFPPGRRVGLLSSFLFTGVTAVVTVVIWRKWWRAKPPILQKRHKMTLEDGLALWNLPIEFIQFLDMGPTINLIDLVQDIMSTSSFFLERFINFSQGVFWGVLVIVLMLLTLYLVLCFIKFFDLDNRLKLWGICGFIGNWADILLPHMSNLLFLPIISTLLSTYDCYRAVGEEYTDSFFNRDCYQLCWSGTHLKFVIAVSIGLCLYTPVAVFTRPIWQELQGNLHIKSTPLDLMIRSVLQISLVSASITLKLDYAAYHAIVFLGLMGAYLLLIIYFPPTNYERLNMWRRLMVIAVLAYGCIGLAYDQIEAVTPLVCTLAVLGAFLALAGVGLFMQTFLKHYRNMLVRDKEDKSDIIKFAFTFGKLAQSHLQNYKARRMQDKYANSDFSSVDEPAAASRRIPISSKSSSAVVTSKK